MFVARFASVAQLVELPTLNRKMRVRFPTGVPATRFSNGLLHLTIHQKDWVRLPATSESWSRRNGCTTKLPVANIGVAIFRGTKTGCSSVWLERLVRDQEAGGSNPLILTSRALQQRVTSYFSLNEKQSKLVVVIGTTFSGRSAVW